MLDTFHDLITASATRSKAKRTKPVEGRPSLPAKVEEQVAFYGLTTWAVYTLRAEFEYSLQDIVKLREKMAPFPLWGHELGIPRPRKKMLKPIPKAKPKPADPTRA